MSSEAYHLAFTDPPGTVIAGIPTGKLNLPSPYVSYGLSFSDSCASHIKNTFRCTKVFLIASNTLARETSEVDKLIQAIGPDQVVHLHKGITSHTPWSEIIRITREARKTNADCLVTLGAGSISDGAKLVALVRLERIKPHSKS